MRVHESLDLFVHGVLDGIEWNGDGKGGGVGDKKSGETFAAIDRAGACHE